MRKRFNPDLPSRLVQSCPRYAITTWRRPDAWIDNLELLGKPAGITAAINDCGILAYSHVATSAFRHASASPKILFQMQPHPVSVRKALLADTLLPNFEDSAFNELNWPDEAFETYSREPLLADPCLASSTYTCETLLENGVRRERVAVLPYGVDVDFVVPGQNKSEKFTVLFVGQLVRQKGLHYLIEAWRQLKLPNAQLRIAGAPSPGNSRFLRNYCPEAVLLGFLGSASLRSQYQNADWLCLPSLSEGFGHVVLEAIAGGTPALVTPSCGASDLIRDNENGLVISYANLDQLVERLGWAFENRASVQDMGAAARKTAEQHSWTRFRQEVVQNLQRVPAAS
ncbi:MAG TPA: glycosyltransferase family 4 protein [Terriglobales bacterium]|nr:glycosyltransferase family 4 protein [Terriglobales bacterium]